MHAIRQFFKHGSKAFSSKKFKKFIQALQDDTDDPFAGTPSAPCHAPRPARTGFQLHLLAFDAATASGLVLLLACCYPCSFAGRASRLHLLAYCPSTKPCDPLLPAAQALRTLSYVGSGGAEVGEVLSTVASIEGVLTFDEMKEAWFKAWDALAERVHQQAEKAKVRPGFCRATVQGVRALSAHTMREVAHAIGGFAVTFRSSVVIAVLGSGLDLHFSHEDGLSIGAFIFQMQTPVINDDSLFLCRARAICRVRLLRICAPPSITGKRSSSCVRTFRTRDARRQRSSYR